ncbi:hypothetical protein M758_6G202800 [Ceratodon purpureus]|uniref:Galactose oxidase n=1 Tax=Ceratodon purpureus TaxID=3225 RepID=A0A8T0HJZ6_CERPU|nr:hypothetical protein KC19_6G211900 [Ceratodon purpureus]KAG0614779.1 hypothetical protein M758_6G202800 [Ceratodon purpureus]
MARVTMWAAVLQLMVMVAWTWSGVEGQGYWEVVVPNAGIASMHSAVTHLGSVVLLDRTNIGDSQLPLPNGVCRDNPADRANTHDCTAHSALYTPGSNAIRPLFVFTDTWCSSGQFDGNGMLVQTGGDADGVTKIRTFTPCGDGNCDWVETATNLQEGRWYASNQILPDGTQIVVGGRGSTTVEYVPANGRGTSYLDLLATTGDAQQDNLYPFVHLLPNNQLFIFANRDSCLFDWQTNTIVGTLPQIPGEPRNYPSAGSSVMLALSAADGFTYAEVLVCGGAQYGAYMSGNTGAPASKTCGRIAPLAAGAGWAMEDMPQARTMGDMVLLPSKQVLIINGAAAGSQGWGGASNAVTAPDLYSPYNAAGTRFQTLTGTNVPRVYHSTANLIQDGSVIVAGSNTHQFYTFTGEFPTELRVERFIPPYMGGGIQVTAGPATLAYGAAFTVTVAANNPTTIELNLIAPPFVTHSYSMGQRLLQLAVSAPAGDGNGGYNVDSTAPPSNVVAPAGYYMMFPVADGAVGYAWWVKIG